MGNTRAKRIVGGGQETTSRMQAVAAAIWELKDDIAGWHWVTCESDGSDRVIEIARESDSSESMIVSVPHREREGLMYRFEEVGLELPFGWVVVDDKRKWLLFGGHLELFVAPEYQDRLPDFVEEAGLKLFGWDQNMSITCSLQR